MFFKSVIIRKIARPPAWILKPENSFIGALGADDQLVRRGRANG